MGNLRDTCVMRRFCVILVLLLQSRAIANTSGNEGWVGSISGTQASQTIAPIATATQETVSLELAEATANTTRVKTRAALKEEPDYVRPASAVAAGEYGEVVISGVLGEDGKIREPRIKVSSRSKLIDDQALADVPRILFFPARDKDGLAIKVPINISLEYTHVEFRGSNGIAQYRCEQAVRDYDWWDRAWNSGKKDRIYGTIRGMVAMRDIRTANLKGVDFDEEWKAAIESCRNQPDKRFLDLLKPDGDFIRSITKT